MLTVKAEKNRYFSKRKHFFVIKSKFRRKLIVVARVSNSFESASVFQSEECCGVRLKKKTMQITHRSNIIKAFKLQLFIRPLTLPENEKKNKHTFKQFWPWTCWKRPSTVLYSQNFHNWSAESSVLITFATKWWKKNNKHLNLSNNRHFAQLLDILTERNRFRRESVAALK